MKLRGFTLLECAVVLSIITIVVLLATPRYQNLVIRSQQQQYISQLASAHLAWMELEGNRIPISVIHDLESHWPYAQRLHDGVTAELNSEEKTITLRDERENSQSQRCSLFELDRYSRLTIRDRSGKIVTERCP